MKILIIGCFHGKFPIKLKNIAKSCDFILSTGDFGGSEKLRKFMFKNFTHDYADKLGKKKTREYYLEDYRHGKKIIKELDGLNKPIYTIDGNWDFMRTARIKKEFGLNLNSYPKFIKNTKNIKFLNKKIRTINGIKIYPHGGLMLASIFHRTEFDAKKRKMYKRWHDEQKKELFRQKSKNLNIMLAHCPPYRYFDKVKYAGVNPMNGKHVGFEPYNEYIKKYHPKLFICGHMHEHQGIARLGKTTILSHGSAQDGKAAILEIKDNKFRIKLIR
jgi:Icc-related predicted phosphoesterase